MNFSARTAPSIGGSPKVNRRQLKSLEVHLGAFQLAVLIGLVTGSMACAFYLGFFSGQRVGYENALVGSASTLARFALNTKELGNTQGEGSSFRASSRTDFDSQEITQPVAKGSAKAESKRLLDLENTSANGFAKDVASNATNKATSVERGTSQEAPSNAMIEAPAQERVPAKKLPSSDLALVKDDEIIRVYGDERQVDNKKHTAIGSLKDAEKSAEVKTTKLTDTVELSKLPTKPVAKETAALKPKVLAGLQPDRATKEEPIAPRRVESVPVKSILAAGWYAQVAAPRKMGDAEGLAARLRKNGFPVSIESANVKGESYYRVIVGPEDNKKQAQVLVEQLKSERSIQGEPFLRNIR